MSRNVEGREPDRSRRRTTHRESVRARLELTDRLQFDGVQRKYGNRIEAPPRRAAPCNLWCARGLHPRVNASGTTVGCAYLLSAALNEWKSALPLVRARRWPHEKKKSSCSRNSTIRCHGYYRMPSAHVCDPDRHRAFAPGRRARSIDSARAFGRRSRAHARLRGVVVVSIARSEARTARTWNVVSVAEPLSYSARAHCRHRAGRARRTPPDTFASLRHAAPRTRS